MGFLSESDELIALKPPEPIFTAVGSSRLLVGSAEDRVVSLGIGAGGTIVQNIEPDTNDPRIWDAASSKILNVQIIDFRTFKLVTGLPPPPTPITADMYAQMGLPFSSSGAMSSGQRTWKVNGRISWVLQR